MSTNYWRFMGDESGCWWCFIHDVIANDDLILPDDTSFTANLLHIPTSLTSSFPHSRSPQPIASFRRLEDEEDLRRRRLFISSTHPDQTVKTISSSTRSPVGTTEASSGKMLRSQVQVLLLTLVSSELLVQVSCAPRRDVLTDILRADLAKDKVSYTFSHISAR